jgi:transcriptional regulator with XRE-family HTH domain
MNSSAFAGRLKELRQAAGFSQQDLAQRAGLTRFGVAQLEQDRREPKWTTVCLLADALGVPTDAFRQEPATQKKAPRGRPKREDP